MRIFQMIGVVNVFIGVVWLMAPLKFYSAAMALFTPEISPPFDAGAVQTVTFLLLLPAILFIMNGITIVFMGERFDRVPELRVFRESGAYVGRVEALEEVGGEIEKFLVEGDGDVKDKGDILAMDDVLIVKDEVDDIASVSPSGVRHEYIGTEVYNKKGEYFGIVESVSLDENQNITELLVLRGDSKKIIKAAEVESDDDVIIIKGEAEDS
jgi:sporulation protein YlmC with PRC-barrel domain